MWSKKDKTWIHYRNDIIASDVSTALFLSAFLRNITYSNAHLNTLEAADLQRYKILKTNTKLKIAIRERRETPFIFIYSRN